MHHRRVAGIQMTSTQDLTENLNDAKRRIEEAVAQRAELVVLPEMFATMGMDEAGKVKHREAIGQGPIQDFLHTQARRHGIWIVGGTIPISISGETNKVRAACLVYNDQGEVYARYDKIHLFDVQLRASQEAYAESKMIEPGDAVVVIPTPFGKMGIGVCYDIRFPEFFRQMQEKGVELIVLPAAFTYTTGVAHWDILVRARAIENLAYVVTACQTGTHPNGRKTFGHSMIVNPWGEVKAVLQLDAGVVVADINLADMAQVRADFPVLTHRKF